jgi:hypothetical protein
MSKPLQHIYLGKAGQFAVMSLFLVRGWNVAVPEVDIGDDIFVVRDENGEFVRVQVKTSTGIKRQKGISAQFSVPIEQLKREYLPELSYCFMVWYDEHWQLPIVIAREVLANMYKSSSIGTVANNKLVLYFSFQDGKIKCSGIDLSRYLNDFSQFPTIPH